MNKTKLASVIILLMMIFISEKSFSQTQENQDQPTQQTDPNTDAQFNSEPVTGDQILLQLTVQVRVEVTILQPRQQIPTMRNRLRKSGCIQESMMGIM